MNTYLPSRNPTLDRSTFAETLSGQFVAITGYGVYVYLNACDVEQLFLQYQNDFTPIADFVRQCVKSVLR